MSDLDPRLGEEIIRVRLLPLFSALGSPVTKRGIGWQVRCPHHDDKEASLHIEPGTKQPVAMHCHALCENADILADLKLTWQDICKPLDKSERETSARAPSRDDWAPGGKTIIARYDYHDENGKLLFQVIRLRTPAGAKKDFRQRRPDTSMRSGWRWSVEGVRKVVYRLPQVLAGIADGNMVYIAEGEKDVHALEAAGAVATTSPGGAGKWLPEYAETFRGAVVRVVADADDAGRKHARAVLDTLASVVQAAEIVEAAEGNDAADHLAAGHSLADFRVTYELTPPPPPRPSLDVYEFLAQTEDDEEWVIKGILERGDRLIWTGEEGLGKTSATRTFAVAAAAGIQPFTNEVVDPQVTLFIDAENPTRGSRRAFRKLVAMADRKGHAVPKDALWVEHRPEGLDLSQRDDRAWLAERVTAYKPDLLVIGPLYKLHSLDIREEPPARLITNVLDEIRVKADCGLIIEAHAPHAEPGRQRDLRPFGSSLFKRWPEFGYGISVLPGTKERKAVKQRVQVIPWRGPRGERHWPTAMEWGNPNRDWPWVPFAYKGDGDWGPTDCLDAA
jgi:AAA domain